MCLNSVHTVFTHLELLSGFLLDQIALDFYSILLGNVMKSNIKYILHNFHK
jgi:hypothetical protein